MTLPLSRQVFAILHGLVEEKVGLSYTADQMELFGDRVSSRAVDCGFESLLDYYYFLRYDDPAGRELSALTEQLVVHETFFFREFDQVRAVVRWISSRAATAGRVRVWSCACSTGEEPLSLAMLLADEGVLDRVSITASDISPRALEKARAGAYGPRSARSIPLPSVFERYTRREGNLTHVAQSLIDAIDWRCVNLLDERAVRALGLFDVILCRNVLIYFRDETVKKLVDRLTTALSVDGVLLVGVSESLIRFSSALACEEQFGSFLYRKGS